MAKQIHTDALLLKSQVKKKFAVSLKKNRVFRSIYTTRIADFLGHCITIVVLNWPAGSRSLVFFKSRPLWIYSCDVSKL